MYHVVFVIVKQVLYLCWRLLPVYASMLLGGWTLFQVSRGASWLWLALPIALVGAIVWWLQQD